MGTIEPKHVLVGVDFSPRSLSAAQMALAIAKSAGTTLELLHVVETQLSESDSTVLGKSRSQLVDLLVDEARLALEHFCAQLEYENLRQTILTGNPAAQITSLAAERNTDLVIVGDTGAGSYAPVKGVGVTTYRLVERGPRNVLVVKAGYSGQVTSVAAAISFVPGADEILRRAVWLAGIYGAELHVLRVIPDIAELRHRLAVLPSDIERALGESVHHNQRRLEEFVEAHQIHDVVTKIVVLPGRPGSALVEYQQKEDIDVIVLGTGTSYRIAGYPIGSTTHKVLNQTISSVFVVRFPEPSP